MIHLDSAKLKSYGLFARVEVEPSSHRRAMSLMTHIVADKRDKKFHRNISLDDGLNHKLTSQFLFFNFAIRHFQENTFNLTIDPSSLGIFAPGPQLSTYRPQILREFESELRFGFRARNGELKGSGVLGTEGDNSPFRGASPKLTSYSDSPYPKPHRHGANLPNRTGFWPE